MKEIHYLIYKITNNINGKYYIGCHKTSNINDNYMGSGKAIKNAIKKYGLENFKKEILFECSSVKEMFNKEREIVTENVVNDRSSYNLKLGGTANFYYVNKHHLNHKSNQHLILANRLKTDSDYRDDFIKKMTIINKKLGIKKRGISTSNKNKVLILKDNKRKYVKPDEIEKYLIQGYTLPIHKTYEYECSNCGKKYTTKRKSKSVNHFCSHRCQIIFNTHPYTPVV